MGIAYKIMFLIGILYTFISFAISSISGALHLGSHLGHMHTHVSGSGHTTGNAGNVNNHSTYSVHASAITHAFLSGLGVLINPIVTVSFLTVFGGLGIIGTDYFKWASALVFFGSLSVGVIVSFLLYKFIVIPLYKSENTANVSREDLLYAVAEVISPILENGFGQIKYTVNSIRYTAPAKHIRGNAIKQGDKVIIYKIEDNIFYVIEYKDLYSIEIDDLA